MESNYVNWVKDASYYLEVLMESWSDPFEFGASEPRQTAGSGVHNGTKFVKHGKVID